MPLNQQNWIDPDSLRIPSNAITDLGIFRAGAAARGRPGEGCNRIVRPSHSPSICTI